MSRTRPQAERGGKALGAAISSKCMPKLRELNLSSNQLGDASLTALSAAFVNGALSGLKLLYVNDNQIGAKGFKAFAKAVSKAGRKVALRQLYLQNNHAGDAGLQAITAALSGKSVTDDATAGDATIEDARTSLGDDFVQESLADPVVSSLMPSYLTDDIGTEGAPVPAETRNPKASVKLPKLAEIYLDGNDAGEVARNAAHAAMRSRNLAGDV